MSRGQPRRSASRSQILNRLKQVNPDKRYNKLPESPLVQTKSNASSSEERATLFVERCAENRIEVHQTTLTSWPDKLREVAQVKSLNNWLIGTETEQSAQAKCALSSNDCDVLPFEKEIEAIKETLFEQIDASFTLAHAGIAETGTLVVVPSSEEPRMMSLIPHVHVVLLHVDQLIDTLQDYTDLLPTRLPTNLLFISSPSKTADIQQTLAYGAHGPKELVVLLCTS